MDTPRRLQSVAYCFWVSFSLWFKYSMVTILPLIQENLLIDIQAKVCPLNTGYQHQAAVREAAVRLCHSLLNE